MDATDYRMGGGQLQYSNRHYKRELFKAYVGFAPLQGQTKPLAPISTGNWVKERFTF